METAQQVEALDMEPNDLSLIPASHIVEGRESAPKNYPLTLTHVHAHTHRGR